VYVLAGEIVGIFAHVERAHEHGAVRFEPRDQRRIARRRRALAIDLGAGERGQSRDVEQVFDRERHAGKRTERAAREPRGVDCPGLCQRAILEHGSERVEHGIVGDDTG